MTSTSSPASDRAGAPWLGQAALIGALLFVAGLGLYNSVHNSIWLDETYTLTTTGTTLGAAFSAALNTELQPPLYFVLLRLWRMAGGSLPFARAFSTVCILLTVVVLHRLSRERGLTRGVFGLALLAATTPHLLWAASEARVYALTVLLTSCSLFYFLRLTEGEAPPRRADQVLYVLSSVAALLTFYYAGFVLLAQGLAGLMSPRRRALLPCWIAIVVLMLPWVPTIRMQMATHPNYEVPVDASAPAALLPWLGDTVRNIVFRSSPFARSLAASGLMAVTLLLLLTARTRAEAPSRWWGTRVVVLGLLPVGALLAIRIGNFALVQDRHWIVTVPGLLLLFADLGARTGDATTGRAGRLLLGLVMVAAAASFARNYRGYWDWRGPAQMITRQAAAGEPIIFYRTLGQAPFAYYFSGGNHLVQVPADGPTTRLDQHDFSAADSATVSAVVAEAIRAGGFWLVERSSIGRDSAVATMAALATIPGGGFDVTASAEFISVRVRHLATRGATAAP